MDGACWQIVFRREEKAESDTTFLDQMIGSNHIGIYQNKDP